MPSVVTVPYFAPPTLRIVSGSPSGSASLARTWTGVCAAFCTTVTASSAATGAALAASGSLRVIRHETTSCALRSYPLAALNPARNRPPRTSLSGTTWLIAGTAGLTAASLR